MRPRMQRMYMTEHTLQKALWSPHCSRQEKRSRISQKGDHRKQKGAGRKRESREGPTNRVTRCRLDGRDCDVSCFRRDIAAARAPTAVNERASYNL